MTKEQRKEAVNLLAQQLQQELGLLKLAQEQRFFKLNYSYFQKLRQCKNATDWSEQKLPKR